MVTLARVPQLKRKQQMFTMDEGMPLPQRSSTVQVVCPCHSPLIYMHMYSNGENLKLLKFMRTPTVENSDCENSELKHISFRIFL